tara:strand:- start:9869 stop:10738 length:870 start_codon:yes stop_codon:yes gene_type:complete
LENQKKKKKILNKLKNKYRLVILNDSTFEEKFSYRLSRLNILTFVTTFAFILILLVSVAIVFTPLREYIPGYTDVSLRQELTTMVIRGDSLENELKRNNKYLANLKAVLSGNLPLETAQIEEGELTVETRTKTYTKSNEDSLLREYVEREDAFSLRAGGDESDKGAGKFYFFPPLKGSITGEFDPSTDHFGIDIVAPKNEAIKAVLNGTVIFAEWTVETGYVIQLQHNDNFTSIYKHNSFLLKKTGDKVKAGEAIAIIGNSGELTSGPHLHFELWQAGSALNPMEYINF